MRIVQIITKKYWQRNNKTNDTKKNQRNNKTVDDTNKTDDTNKIVGKFAKMEKQKFEQCERYSRRGIVISQSDDQMQSMVIQPGTPNKIFICRICLYFR